MNTTTHESDQKISDAKEGLDEAIRKTNEEVERLKEYVKKQEHGRIAKLFENFSNFYYALAIISNIVLHVMPQIFFADIMRRFALALLETVAGSYWVTSFGFLYAKRLAKSTLIDKENSLQLLNIKKILLSQNQTLTEQQNSLIKKAEELSNKLQNTRKHKPSQVLGTISAIFYTLAAVVLFAPVAGFLLTPFGIPTLLAFSALSFLGGSFLTISAIVAKKEHNKKAELKETLTKTKCSLLNLDPPPISSENKALQDKIKSSRSSQHNAMILSGICYALLPIATIASFFFPPLGALTLAGLGIAHVCAAVFGVSAVSLSIASGHYAAKKKESKQALKEIPLSDNKDELEKLINEKLSDITHSHTSLSSLAHHETHLAEATSTPESSVDKSSSEKQNTTKESSFEESSQNSPEEEAQNITDEEKEPPSP